MSKYDSINSAMELIREVISHGISNDTEDRNRAADIFGRSAIGELAELANSREEISGKNVGATFYFIAFNIWNWLDACNFWNQHTNFAMKDNIRLREENKRLTDEVNCATQNNQYHAKLAEDSIAKLEDMEIDLANCQIDFAACQHEVIVLKAKLYDLMTAEESK